MHQYEVEAASDFVNKTGGLAAIGALEDVSALLDEAAGTIISTRVDSVNCRLDFDEATTRAASIKHPLQ